MSFPRRAVDDARRRRKPALSGVDECPVHDAQSGLADGERSACVCQSSAIENDSHQPDHLLGPQAPLGLLEKEECAHNADEPDGWRFRDDRCRFDGLEAFNWVTGEAMPGREPHCKNARCRRCASAYHGRTFGLARMALDYVERARLVTFTLASETDAESWTWADWQEARRVQRQNLRRKGYRYEALYVVERGKETDRQHMHDVQHGDFIPKEILSASWPHGMTNIRSVAGAAASYLSKQALPYLAKEVDVTDDRFVGHMNDNGGRAEHHTRGFFAGHSRDVFARRHPFHGPSLVGVMTVEAGRLGDWDAVEVVSDDALRRIRNIGGMAMQTPAHGPAREHGDTLLAHQNAAVALADAGLASLSEGVARVRQMGIEPVAERLARMRGIVTSD